MLSSVSKRARSILDLDSKVQLLGYLVLFSIIMIAIMIEIYRNLNPT